MPVYGDGMQSWRRMTLLGVLVFVVAVTVWAFTAHWSDTVNIKVAKGQPPQSVTFQCGKLFDGTAPRTGGKIYSPNAYSNLGHKPCSGRTERRILVVVDDIVGVAALFVLLTRFAPHRNEVSAPS